MKETTEFPRVKVEKIIYPVIITEHYEDQERKRYEIGVEIERNPTNWEIMWIKVSEKKFKQIFGKIDNKEHGT